MRATSARAPARSAPALLAGRLSRGVRAPPVGWRAWAAAAGYEHAGRAARTPRSELARPAAQWALAAARAASARGARRAQPPYGVASTLVRQWAPIQRPARMTLYASPVATAAVRMGRVSRPAPSCVAHSTGEVREWPPNQVGTARPRTAAGARRVRIRSFRVSGYAAGWCCRHRWACVIAASRCPGARHVKEIRFQAEHQSATTVGHII
mmetsp:Transcript_5436/g.18369  ORF Transcript_5436/g.18369 Transcript_5436/m.18369 type:complete len:210 (+) Transcript_5436:723-1352(+)